jgi:mRNA interferase MazF
VTEAVAHPRQFDVWWISLPDPVGRRPVLLLSRSTAYTRLQRVLVAEVTTTVRGIPQEVRLGSKEGLTRVCVANLDAGRYVRPEQLVSRVGALRASRHVEVKRALGHVLAWPELTSL